MEDKNISGVYELHDNSTFRILNDMWEIKTKYTDSNKLYLINRTTDIYISGLFKVKGEKGFYSFDYQGDYYYINIDDDAVYIEYSNPKSSKK